MCCVFFQNAISSSLSLSRTISLSYSSPLLLLYYSHFTSRISHFLVQQLCLLAFRPQSQPPKGPYPPKIPIPLNCKTLRLYLLVKMIKKKKKKKMYQIIKMKKEKEKKREKKKKKTKMVVKKKRKMIKSRVLKPLYLLLHPFHPHRLARLNRPILPELRLPLRLLRLNLRP